MRILMFGWEFPPHMSGGLGTACFGMTKALVERGHHILFVLPSASEETCDSHVELLSASRIPLSEDAERGPLTGLDLHRIRSSLRPYPSPSGHRQPPPRRSGGRSYVDLTGQYGPDLLSEVIRYGNVAGAVGAGKAFDVIHAHDWMSVFAGLRARSSSGKPLVLHIHALEYDRSGENINRDIFEIERWGMTQADAVVAVSHYTKGRIVELYGIPAEKIFVVHNAVSRSEAQSSLQVVKIPVRKIVLFLGRITFQKGPDYFVAAAAKLLRRIPDLTFVMAGSGDMMIQMVERVAELGIGQHFHFTGFLRGEDVERMFAMSDLYVMPSVSEPFGISPLEAMMYDVPVILSKSSGVAEILRHAPQVDFWDVDGMAEKMAALLSDPDLARQVVEDCRIEMQRIHWDRAAEELESIYHRLIRSG
ncbi:MAG TPA: glycosyltransferase family 4 protein [Syntrophales bacterium]|nr:glycosyltransferase family 4 protein [Syntrophales bacterium]